MLEIAISPCPNDTFLFYAWIHDLLGEKPTTHFADIQRLNQWAHQKKFPLIKVSIATFPHIKDDYSLLPIGAALGFSCGPKVIGKKRIPLKQAKVAIPGKQTTAHLLFDKLLPPCKEKVFCLYHEVEDLILKGIVDCGVIIHETRFTFAQNGLVELFDLGELWEEQTNLPLPLGALALHNRLAPEPVIQTLQASLAYARNHFEEMLPFIIEKSQDKDPNVVRAHIGLYVNQETENLSETGLCAIEELIGYDPSLFCTLA